MSGTKSIRLLRSINAALGLQNWIELNVKGLSHTEARISKCMLPPSPTMHEDQHGFDALITFLNLLLFTDHQL